MNLRSNRDLFGSKIESAFSINCLWFHPRSNRSSIGCTTISLIFSKVGCYEHQGSFGPTEAQIGPTEPLLKLTKLPLFQHSFTHLAFTTQIGTTSIQASCKFLYSTLHIRIHLEIMYTTSITTEFEKTNAIQHAYFHKWRGFYIPSISTAHIYKIMHFTSQLIK